MSRRQLPAGWAGPVHVRGPSFVDPFDTTAHDGGERLEEVNVYLVDWNDWETFNRIYVERIAPYGTPPRTTVRVAGLAPGFWIEIEAVAHVQPSSE